MIVTTSIILIFISVWNFVNIIDTSSIEIIETIPSTVELLKEVNTLLAEKDLLLLNYRDEILNLTLECQDLNEKLELTQHSLNMANEALNNLTVEGNVNDGFDYEGE